MNKSLGCSKCNHDGHLVPFPFTTGAKVHPRSKPPGERNVLLELNGIAAPQAAATTDPENALMAQVPESPRPNTLVAPPRPATNDYPAPCPRHAASSGQRQPFGLSRRGRNGPGDCVDCPVQVVAEARIVMDPGEKLLPVLAAAAGQEGPHTLVGRGGAGGGDEGEGRGGREIYKQAHNIKLCAVLYCVVSTHYTCVVQCSVL